MLLACSLALAVADGVRAAAARVAPELRLAVLRDPAAREDAERFAELRLAELPEREEADLVALEPLDLVALEPLDLVALEPPDLAALEPPDLAALRPLGFGALDWVALAPVDFALPELPREGA